MKDILQQIQNLKEDFMNLIEVEGLGQPASDVPPSTNKIKKDRKTKNGKVELVSVEDELFPYDGNKREQYRQKIIDTINGMIQGTATLEDLLQIVREKKAPLKEAMEVLERISDENVEKVIGAWNAEYLKQNMPSKTRKEFEEKVQEKTKKKAPLEEALKLLEGWAKDKRPEAAKKSIDGRRREYLNKLANVLDAADIYGSENVPDGDVKDLDRAEGRYAHAKKVSKIEEALQLLESIILEAKPKDPEGYKKNIDIANHYDHLYSISPAKAPDGSPNSVAAEWNRRYQHYFNKAMKCYYGDGSKKKDSIKEALSLMEAIINEISNDLADSAFNKRQAKVPSKVPVEKVKGNIRDSLIKLKNQLTAKMIARGLEVLPKDRAALHSTPDREK